MTAPLLPLNLGFGLGGIIDEFGRSLFEEDYGLEAANAERFSALFADNDAVYIPKVERMLSSTRVLTTTWIDGAKMRDSEELRSQRLDPTALIRTGVICGLQQLLEFGYFHADPHPGNLFALPGRTGDLGHVGYVDFGMMDSISDSDRLTLTGAVVHLINRDFSGLAKDFQSLGFSVPRPISRRSFLPLKRCSAAALATRLDRSAFKAITDRFRSDVRLPLPGAGALRFDHPGCRQPGRPRLAAGSELPNHRCGLSVRGPSTVGG